MEEESEEATYSNESLEDEVDYNDPSDLVEEKLVETTEENSDETKSGTYSNPLLDGTYFEVLDNRYNTLRLKCLMCGTSKGKETVISSNVGSSSNIYAHLKVS